MMEKLPYPVERSAYSWMGGKFYESRVLIPLMPIHHTYCEVFGGSFVLLINKPKSVREFGNDKFSCLVSFWNTLQNYHKTKKLIALMKNSLDSRQTYQDYMRAEPEDLGQIDRAYRFLYLCNFGFNCYDKETEILTKDKGWIKFGDLTMDDQVACLSKDHIFYWNKPTALQKYHYEGKMIRIKHKSIDLLITSNHNLYVRKHWKKQYEFVKANNFKRTQYHTINSVDWIGEEKKCFYLPKIENIKYSTNQINIDKILMDDWLEFLGWYIAEGSSTLGDYNNHKSYIICIGQKDINNRNEIIDVCKRIGLNPIETNGSIRLHCKQLYEYLKPLSKSYEKYIPKEFMNLSKRQLKILFDAMIKGDGSVSEKGQKVYYTTSKKLADQVQEVAIKIGYNSSMSIKNQKKGNCIEGREIFQRHILYQINIRRRKECIIYFENKDRNNFFKEEYNGFIYCCTVPEHIILVRRNGKVVFCGQSYMDTFYSPLTHELEKIKDHMSVWQNNALRLLKLHWRIKNVMFNNYDFRVCLQKQKPHPNRFIFLDPPYIDTHQYNRGYGTDLNFPKSWYNDMRDELKIQHDGGTKWMITCNSINEYFDEMDDVIIKFIDRRACINNNEIRKDVCTKVVMNYDVDDVGSCLEMLDGNELQGGIMDV